MLLCSTVIGAKVIVSTWRIALCQVDMENKNKSKTNLTPPPQKKKQKTKNQTKKPTNQTNK